VIQFTDPIFAPIFAPNFTDPILLIHFLLIQFFAPNGNPNHSGVNEGTARGGEEIGAKQMGQPVTDEKFLP
jgi:hypothetical protein